MQNMLEAIGRYSYTHPWRVLSAWVLIIMLTVAGALTFMKSPNDAVTIPGTAADSGLTRMKELFPDAGAGSARIVAVAPEGKTLDSYKSTIDTLVTDVSKTDGVELAVGPFDNPTGMSKDKRTGIIQVQMAGSAGEIDKATTEKIHSAIDSARGNGLIVESGGDIVAHMPGKLLGAGELVGVGIALVVLIITLGSLVAAGMPVGLAIAGVGISLAGLFSLSHVVSINSTTPALAAMLGLAVGIDYSLFIISKYRSYLFDGADYRTAAIRAVRTAGSAVVFAAMTVVIALAALAVVNIPFMTTMGLSGAATVAIASMLAVSALPALLRLVGPRIFRDKQRALVAKAQKKGFKPHHNVDTSKLGYRWGKLTTKAPALIVLVAVLVIGVVAWPVRDMQMGLPSDQYAARETTERKAYDAISDGFGVGYNSPLMVVVEGVTPVTDAEKQAAKQQLLAQFEAEYTKQAMAKQAEFQARFASVTSPEEMMALQAEMQQLAAQGEVQKAEALKMIDAKSGELGKRLHLQQIADKVATQKNVDNVVVALASDDGSHGVLQVLPKSAPYDHATTELIGTLRDPQVQKDWTDDKVTVNVTGSTAMQIDVNEKLAAALPVYLAVVVGLSLVLLVLAFRSILVPLKATLGYVLSVLAMFGALTAVFQWGWFGITDAPGPIVSFIPIIASGILFGLAMDYEFFLVSTMDEEYVRTKDAKKAVVNGFSLGSRVVTAAAIIMISVFAGFITNEASTVQAIGFALAVGVFVDAFIVRMTIVPAVMSMLGSAAWWLPNWLDKWLPDIAIDEE